MSDRAYVLGIDGGGTRSRAVAVSAGGQILGRAAGGPLNFYAGSEDQFASSLGALLGEFQSLLPDGKRIHTVIGTGALFTKASDEERGQALRCVPEKERGSFTVLGDAVTALAGATLGKPGILVISGTGSIAIAQTEHGELEYRGGCGPLIGSDPGSAYWVACQAIVAAPNHPPLENAVCEYFDQNNLPAVIRSIYRMDSSQRRVAELAAHLAEHPDTCELEIWNTIEQKAGAWLAAFVDPLCDFLAAEWKKSVYCSGSVLRKNQTVRDVFTEELSNMMGCDIETPDPALDAASGAALLACQQANWDTHAFLLSARGEGSSS